MGDLKRWPKVHAEFDAVRAVLDNRSAKVFVWDGGGELFVDMQTANVLVTIHDAMNFANQVTFAEALARSRGAFLRMVDFAWKHVT